MKKNDIGLLVMLGGLAALAYFLLKGNSADQTPMLGGGSAGYSIEIPPLTQGAINPNMLNKPVTENIQIGITEPPVMGKIQAYKYAGENKQGYIQRQINLTTTPAMRSPTIVQARSIIKSTSGIDVGKLTTILKRR